MFTTPMPFNKYITAIFLLFFVSCHPANNKRIAVDELIAEGNISKDSTYNGVIKFYDSSTDRLVSQATYRNDTLDGERIEYYSNGKQSAILNYSEGKENGYTILYDSLGTIQEKQFYYYGLRVGPSISYKSGQPNEFRFFSFDNFLLFYINYDSIKNKRIGDWQDNFFYINKSQTFEINSGLSFDSTQLKNEYFIYLIEPLGYNFIYSLCIIDNTYKVYETLTTMKTSNHWETFTIDTASEIGDKVYAIKLDVFKEKELLATLFKKLN